MAGQKPSWSLIPGVKEPLPPKVPRTYKFCLTKISLDMAKCRFVSITSYSVKCFWTRPTVIDDKFCA